MTQTYIGYYFKISPKSPWDEILLAQLQDLPFESFEMSETGLNAYVAEKDHFESFLSSISLLENKELKIEYTSRSIEPENWNTKWEEAFDIAQDAFNYYPNERLIKLIDIIDGGLASMSL